MSEWIIIKSTRASMTPYKGVTCELAGIKPGQIYTDKMNAEKDAAKLTAKNGVGFVVIKYKPDLAGGKDDK